MDDQGAGLSWVEVVAFVMVLSLMDGGRQLVDAARPSRSCDFLVGRPRIAYRGRADEMRAASERDDIAVRDRTCSQV